MNVRGWAKPYLHGEQMPAWPKPIMILPEEWLTNIPRQDREARTGEEH